MYFNIFLKESPCPAPRDLLISRKGCRNAPGGGRGAGPQALSYALCAGRPARPLLIPLAPASSRRLCQTRNISMRQRVVDQLRPADHEAQRQSFSPDAFKVNEKHRGADTVRRICGKDFPDQSVIPGSLDHVNVKTQKAIAKLAETTNLT